MWKNSNFLCRLYHDYLSAIKKNCCVLFAEFSFKCGLVLYVWGSWPQELCECNQHIKHHLHFKFKYEKKDRTGNKAAGMHFELLGFREDLFVNQSK